MSVHSAIHESFSNCEFLQVLKLLPKLSQRERDELQEYEIKSMTRLGQAPEVMEDARFKQTPENYGVAIELANAARIAENDQREVLHLQQALELAPQESIELVVTSAILFAAISIGDKELARSTAEKLIALCESTEDEEERRYRLADHAGSLASEAEFRRDFKEVERWTTLGLAGFREDTFFWNRCVARIHLKNYTGALQDALSHLSIDENVEIENANAIILSLFSLCLEDEDAEKYLGWTATELAQRALNLANADISMLPRHPGVIQGYLNSIVACKHVGLLTGKSYDAEIRSLVKLIDGLRPRPRGQILRSVWADHIRDDLPS